MKKEEFKPYISNEHIQTEFTPTSIIIGILLSVVFGAANAYLGLRVGLTISASIPAAVISMGVLRIILRKNSILESNMVQTIGSAGESLAAGSIFTMPVLFLWSKEGLTEVPSLLTISLLAFFGGILGILFMVPLRNALIVKEHYTLPYPEGTACAEVLLAGESNNSGANTVFAGIGISALIKFIVDGLKIIPSTITTTIHSLKTEFSVQVYPALTAVGYICGFNIAAYMFAGGLLGWFVLIPAIVFFGGNSIITPQDIAISQLSASEIWSSYIRYIGAGAVACGGIISLIKSLPLIISTFSSTLRGLKEKNSVTNKRTNINLDIRIVGILIALVILAIWLIPVIPVGLLGAVLIAIFGFFFATVSSRMVGLVGSSNNPVSGMTIATLLVTAFIIKSISGSTASGMIATIAIGSVICIISAMAGDTSQDLKTGYILGATPMRQQIGEMIGASVSAITIGGVLLLLDKAWGFGTTELSAPQAMLMKLITEGVMNGQLPWVLVFIGVFIAIAIELTGIPVLPVAIGLYLPLELSAPIMLGGVLSLIIKKINHSSNADSHSSRGILFSSGLIAGEGLVGIILAILAVVGIDRNINLQNTLNLGITGSILLLLFIILLMLYMGLNKKGNKNE